MDGEYQAIYIIQISINPWLYFHSNPAWATKGSLLRGLDHFVRHGFASSCIPFRLLQPGNWHRQILLTEQSRCRIYDRSGVSIVCRPNWNSHVFSHSLYYFKTGSRVISQIYIDIAFLQGEIQVLSEILGRLKKANVELRRILIHIGCKFS